MKITLWKLISLIIAALSLSLALSACGGGSGTTSATSPPTGAVNLNVTDAPSMDYAHVYVTIKSIAFHVNDTAGSNTAGWQTVNLSAPVTVDLAQLANGKMYSDTAGNPLFNGFVLPVGIYKQIRIFLSASEDTYEGSIVGLTYNNEVQLPGDLTHYVLRIPTPDEGIRLVPESPVVVSAGGNVKIALDFNLNNDVVEVAPNGTKEFILKPRLGYFDMNSVGAVSGTVSFGNLSTSRFVIKAEQVKAGVNYRVVRRWTSVDKTTGKFNLYPLPIFGNNTTATYDILLRGIKAQTAIVKGVKVHKGTTLSTGAVNLGAITMQPGTDFTAQISSGMHPSGAWLNFYQTIAGDPIPYEVRYRHLNPYTGKMWKAIELSNSPIQVATYDNSAGTVGLFTADVTSQGTFSAISDAILYSRGASVTVSNGPSPVPFIPGTPTAQSAANSITTTISMPARLMGMTRGHLFITHGGLVVDSYDIDSMMVSGGGSKTISNLPGGTVSSPLAGAYYGVYAIGWGSGKLGFGTQRHIDLTSGDATSAITLR